MNKPLILTADTNPVNPEPGIYHNIPWQEYASWDAFSKSMVAPALKSGLHLDHYIHAPRQSASMSFGSLVDCLTLEPGEFDKRYMVQPATYPSEKTSGRGANKVTETITKPWNLNSKTCKSIVKKAAARGVQFVSESELTKAQAAAEAVTANDEARRAITYGDKQVSLVWDDERTGVRCKGRCDIVGAHTIDDLKTARDASPEDFSRAIGKFGYHVQAFAYTDAWRQLTGEDKAFRFIVVENGDIPAVALYELDSVSIIAGGLMFRRALTNVKRWLERGVEGYSRFVEPITAPAWMVDREISMSDEEIEL